MISGYGSDSHLVNMFLKEIFHFDDWAPDYYSDSGPKEVWGAGLALLKNICF